jgi:hypothetical protein
VSTNLSFVGPVVPHFRGVQGFASVTGGMPEGRWNDHVMRDLSVDSGAIDAPAYLPRGSVKLSTYSRFTLESQVVLRPRGYR